MLHKKIVVIDEHINLTDTDGFKRMKSLSPISTNLSDSKTKFILYNTTPTRL